MLCQSEVTFSGKLPSPEEILNRVREISQLPQLKLVADGYCKFEHEEFVEPGFVFFDDADRYKLLHKDDRTTYLAGVTLRALVDLGGSYPRELDTWTGKPWIEVQEQFPRSLFDKY